MYQCYVSRAIIQPASNLGDIANRNGYGESDLFRRRQFVPGLPECFHLIGLAQ